MKITPRNVQFLRRRRRSAFTLMELMLVLGIISLLIVAGLKIGPAVTKTGRNTAAKAGIGNISAFITNYSSTHSGRLPKSLDDLKGILEEDAMIDPWGNQYKYVVPAKRSKDKYDLYSTGDKVEDETDDIGNWSE